MIRLRQVSVIVVLCPLAFAALTCLSRLAEAGCSWYLLVPPRSPYDAKAPFLHGIKILTDSPLSKWYHEGSYDSAAACETLKASNTLREHSIYSQASDEYIRLLGVKGTDEKVLSLQRLRAEQDNANVDALRAARCIASDDARLR